MRSRSRLRHRHMLQTDGPVFVSGDGSILLSAMVLRHVGKRSPRGERSQPEGGGAGAKTPARGRFGGVQAARISARARAERVKSSRDR